MSRELTKMNLIAIVQQLPEDDIDVIQTYIGMIEKENQQLKEMIDKEDGCNHRRKQIFELKDKLAKALKENQQLKSTLEEIREYIEDSGYQISEDVTYDLLQIIEESDIK